VVKHVLGFCFFAALGFLLGAIPFGLLYSYLTDNWGKEAPLYGALAGAACFGTGYLARAAGGAARGLGARFARRAGRIQGQGSHPNPPQ
jgi:hypothetical protein